MTPKSCKQITVAVSATPQPSPEVPSALDAQDVAAQSGRQMIAPPVSQEREPSVRLAVLEELMRDLVQRGKAQQRARNGRELAIFERDFDRIAALVDALVEGNYRDTAARIAGLSASGVRAWLRAADEGDSRYEAVAEVIRTAESIAEADSVRDVRVAGKDPRFWAASMTWLERKFPDRWARRQEVYEGPRIIVQIGVKESDVQIGLSPEEIAQLPRKSTG